MDQFYMQFDASNHLDKYLLILRSFDAGGPEWVKLELGFDLFCPWDWWELGHWTWIGHCKKEKNVKNGIGKNIV